LWSAWVVSLYYFLLNNNWISFLIYCLFLLNYLFFGWVTHWHFYWWIFIINNNILVWLLTYNTLKTIKTHKILNNKDWFYGR
jgi:hypothetical protein